MKDILKISTISIWLLEIQSDFVRRTDLTRSTQFPSSSLCQTFTLKLEEIFQLLIASTEMEYIMVGCRTTQYISRSSILHFDAIYVVPKKGLTIENIVKAG